MQNHPLYFVRHAQSEYNLAQLKALNSEVESTKNEDYTVKWDPKLIDATISELGLKQALEAKQKLQDVKVALVLTSPLRRCLETTSQIFKDHKNKPKIVVWPTLKEMLLSSCDIPDDLDVIKKEYPTFDFSVLDKFPIPELWLYYMFTDETVGPGLLDELFKKYGSKEEAIKNAKFFLLEKIKTVFPTLIEAHTDIRQRTIEARQALKDKLKEFKEGEAVVVVAHSRFLEAYTAESIEADGSPVNAKWFYNCEVAPSDVDGNIQAESL